MEKDNINPSHYKDSCSIECIEAMECMLGAEGLLNFCLGNALKYVWRFRNKNGIEDLYKAKWYLNKAVAILREMSCPWDSHYDGQVTAIKKLVVNYIHELGGKVNE